MYVSVAVFSPVRSLFDYIWPEELGEPCVGIRVLVPFGHSKKLAVVLEILNGGDSPNILKKVFDRFDETSLLTNERRHWLYRASHYYLCGLGEMYETALSWSALDYKRQYRCVNVEGLESFDTNLKIPFKTKRGISYSTIAKQSDHTYLHWRIRHAVKDGYLEELFSLTEEFVFKEAQPLKLRESQQKAVSSIANHYSDFFGMLLFGCTGSGKTEVYLHAAKNVVNQGKQVLILVPEIGLTPMWLNRLQSRFEHVGIWHSGLSYREKLRVIHDLPTTDIILGTRSALFLPLNKLGFIVIDEEHDMSFKQQDGVAYSARDMSFLLAQELQIPLMLGSATPSLESWKQVEDGAIDCVRLTERVYEHTAITPEIIDMRGNHDAFSSELLKYIKETHSRGEQIMLYLNRRGYAPALQCTSCGEVPTCPSCSLRLTLHRHAGVLRCHTCDYRQRVYKICKNCGESAFLPLGMGTERLEDELKSLLPTLRVSRFDRDVIRKNEDLETTLAAFEKGEIDCLIGTQMLVKGHHFPNVTLVGVMNADLGMNLPDFRASERWWQQMTQVFGRTGRGAQAGNVVVQTHSPNAHWFSKLDESQSENVLNEELGLRKMLSFPPYARWVRIIFSSQRHEKAIIAARDFNERLQGWDDVKVSGPMPCALEKIAGRFRFELVIRDETKKHLPWKLLPLLQSLRIPSGVRRKVDVDPQELM